MLEKNCLISLFDFRDWDYNERATVSWIYKSDNFIGTGKFWQGRDSIISESAFPKLFFDMSGCSVISLQGEIELIFSE